MENPSQNNIYLCEFYVSVENSTKNNIYLFEFYESMRINHEIIFIHVNSVSMENSSKNTIHYENTPIQIY